MKQLDTEVLRNNLRTVVNDVEQVLHSMSGTTGERAEDFKHNAARTLRDARNRLGEMERQTARQLRRASRQTQGYVKDHPWHLVGGLAAAAITLALLSRTRH